MATLIAFDDMFPQTRQAGLSDPDGRSDRQNHTPDNGNLREAGSVFTQMLC